MSSKTKNKKTGSDTFQEIAQRTGILLMGAAVTLGMFELPDRQSSRLVVLPSQPAPVLAIDNNENLNNPIRREREESAPHYISYSVAQRTPARSGRH
ncbi:MAG TPA: hypothetical protein VLF79_00450 [Candidatus Saccharimonadales bacterium]|nr:hypothetical protein [Candidatus Saccharimonadales bacterium]